MGRPGSGLGLPPMAPPPRMTVKTTGRIRKKRSSLRFEKRTRASFQAIARIRLIGTLLPSSASAPAKPAVAEENDGDGEQNGSHHQQRTDARQDIPQRAAEGQGGEAGQGPGIWGGVGEDVHRERQLGAAEERSTQDAESKHQGHA